MDDPGRSRLRVVGLAMFLWQTPQRINKAMEMKSMPGCETGGRAGVNGVAYLLHSGTHCIGLNVQVCRARKPAICTHPVHTALSARLPENRHTLRGGMFLEDMLP